MTYRVREYTCRILNALDEGIMDKDYLIRTMLDWMSESDVKQMYLANGLLCLDEEEEEEEEYEVMSDLENPNSVHSRYHY